MCTNLNQHVPNPLPGDCRVSEESIGSALQPWKGLNLKFMSTQSKHTCHRYAVNSRGSRGCSARPCASAAAPSVLSSTDAPPSTPVLKLFYRTGWDRAVVHGSLCGGAWKDYPLTKVRRW